MYYSFTIREDKTYLAPKVEIYIKQLGLKIDSIDDSYKYTFVFASIEQKNKFEKNLNENFPELWF